MTYPQDDVLGRTSSEEKIASHIGAVQAHPGCTDPRGPAIVADHRMSLKGGYAMRTFDLAPLYRSTVGFDRLFSMLDGFEAAPGYPPYNIERTGEND